MSANALRVSVITPTYNRAEYLPHALESIFRQSLAPYEIIVVDDGSSDNTGDILRSYRSKVHYLRQEHKGVAEARNLGLEAARGDVIAWLDADDVWEDDFLATLVPFLARHPDLDGVYCGLSHIDAAGKVLPIASQKVVPPQELFSALIESDFVVTSTFVVRKRCFEQVGAFDPQFSICEDYDMFLRLAKIFTIAGIPDLLVHLRVHEDSTMMRDKVALCKFRLALAEKHFGPYEGNPLSWPDDKRRAHAYAFLTCCSRYIQDGQPDEGWRYLDKAVSVWPDLLGRLDVFYELACGDQPRGFRGRADLLDIDANGTDMLSRLDDLFTRSGSALAPVRGTAYGNAHLALGILNDQAGRWAQARSCLFRAITANPRLLTSYSVVRRILKLCSGRRLVRLAQALRAAG